MADTTDILALRIPSADGSDAADLAQIIGDLGADVDAAVGNPSFTTAQINALTGDEKAAGRRVWDSTLGVEKVSNGTTWEIQAVKSEVDAKLPLAGGTLSGDLLMGGTAAARGIGFVDDDGDLRFWVRYEKATGKLAIQRYSEAGADIDQPFAITTAGQVVSSSHIGGVASATGIAAGSVTLPTSPTGNWSVTLTAKDSVVLRVTGTSSTSFSWASTEPPGAVHWHAIAY